MEIKLNLFFLFYRYVHVAFHDSEERAMVKPYSLVICGLVEGQTDQYACAFRDAICMLLSTWEPMRMTAAAASKTTFQSNEITSFHRDGQIHNAPPFQQCLLQPGCVIPAGGTFEFLLNHALMQHGHRCSPSEDKNIQIPAVSHLLANALLSVPRQIYSHNPRFFLQTQTRLLNLIKNNSHPVNLLYGQEHKTIHIQGPGKSECSLEEGKQSVRCRTETDVLSEVFMCDSGLESVSCKYQLLLAVLYCASSLLQVDTVLHTHADLRTQSQRLANVSWEDTEDEAED